MTTNRERPSISFAVLIVSYLLFFVLVSVMSHPHARCELLSKCKWRQIYAAGLAVEDQLRHGEPGGGP